MCAEINQNMKKESLYQYVLLSLFVLVIIANHVFGYLGHYGWDDMHYAEMANDVLQGTIQYNDHFFTVGQPFF